MKKAIILTLTIFYFSTQAGAQITKGNWLLGGSGTYSAKKQQFEPDDVTVRRIEANPNVGYFFADKFAGGIKFNVTSEKLKQRGIEGAYTTLGIGPFVRYYFFPVNHQVKMVGQGSYQYTPTWSHDAGTDDPQHFYTLTAGPAIFLNSSVALELTLNYQIAKSALYSANHKTVFLAVGFQFHLEKDDN